MKLKVSLKELKELLPSIVKMEGEGIMEKEEIKNNIYIQAGEDFLLLRVVNSNGGIEAKIHSLTEQNGHAVVKKETFSAVVSNSFGEKMELEIETEGTLKIKTESNRSEISLIKNFDYPELPNENPKHIEEVDVNNLIEGINSVNAAASKGVIRPQLSSVFIKIEKETLIIVSTDGYRLIEYKTKLDKAVGSLSVLVGVKNALKISRSLETQREEKICLGEVEDGLVFFNDKIKIYTSIIKKDFPNYEEMLLRKSDKEIELEKSKVVNFLRRANFFNNRKNKMYIFVEKNKVTLSIRDELLGSTSEEIQANTSDMPELPAYNYKFILDIVRVMKEDKILFCFNETDKTLVVKEKGGSVVGLIAYQTN